MSAAAAQAFANRFLGNGLPANEAIPLSVDDFDTFIIDGELADDPGPADPSEAVYKGFIRQRSEARNAINNGARKLENDQAFQVVIITPGKLYGISRISGADLSTARDIGNKVEMFTKGRVKGLQTLQAKATKRALDHNDLEMGELSKKLHLLQSAGIDMHQQVKSLTQRFNMVADSLEEQLQARIAEDGADVSDS